MHILRVTGKIAVVRKSLQKCGSKHIGLYTSKEFLETWW